MFLYYIIIGLQRAKIRVRAPKEGKKEHWGSGTTEVQLELSGRESRLFTGEQAN